MLVNSGRIHNLDFTFCFTLVLGVLCQSTIPQSKLLAFGKALKTVKPSSLLICLYLLPLVYPRPNLVLVHGKPYFYLALCTLVLANFLVVALLGSGTSIWMTALTVIALDIRHVLYGPALQNLIQDRLNLKKTAVWAWGLTDEVFAAGMIKLSQRRQEWSESWMLGLSLFSWMSWALGSFLGGLFADQVSDLPQFLQAALDFLLPALFLSFLLAAFEKKHTFVVAVSLVVSALACYFINMSAAIFIGIASGILAGLFKHYVLKQTDEVSI